MENPLSLRLSGVILHPTSLPGPQSCGTLGEQAHRWVDWLDASGFGIWQFLPLTPVTDGSPYNSYSAFAGNIQLIDLQTLQGWGFPALEMPVPLTPQNLLQALAQQHRWFEQQQPQPLWQEMQDYCASQSWLNDFCLFSALKEQHPVHWVEWPAPLRDRAPAALEAFATANSERLRFHRFAQVVFHR